MKFLLLIFLLFNSLFALSINESLLSIHATLLPKIPFMDYKYKEKLTGNAITIVVYYNKANYKSAKILKEKINLKYIDGIRNHPIDIKLLPYDAKENFKANIYYLFPSNDKNIKDILKKASLNKALTFSYSQNSLSLGCMISLNIKAKVKPIINLSAIKSNNISLRPVLLNISDIYNSETI